VIGVPRVIDPGKHAIAARATGFEKSDQDVDIEEGKSAEVTIALAPTAPSVAPSSSASAHPTASASSSAPPPPPTSGPWKTVGLVAGGTGVALVIGGVVTGLIGKGKLDQLDKDCKGVHTGCSVPNLESRKDSIRTFQTTTNVLLIGGGVLAAAGIGLFLLTPSEQSSNSSISLQISPGIQGGHVSLTGSF
jgi:hypothetical protein